MTIDAAVNAAMTAAVQALGTTKQTLADRVLRWYAESSVEVQVAIFNSAHVKLRPELAQFLRRLADELDRPAPSPTSGRSHDPRRPFRIGRLADQEEGSGESREQTGDDEESPRSGCVPPRNRRVSQP